MRPCLAAITRPVNAVAITIMPATMVFAGSDPDRVRVGGINRHRSDREDVLIVKYRRPGRAGVLRAPDTARTDADDPCGRIVLQDFDIADPARHESRSDIAEFKPVEIGRGHRIGGRLLF
jgi:hypothetical protein